MDIIKIPKIVLVQNVLKNAPNVMVVLLMSVIVVINQAIIYQRLLVSNVIKIA